MRNFGGLVIALLLTAAASTALPSTVRHPGHRDVRVVDRSPLAGMPSAPRQRFGVSHGRSANGDSDVPAGVEFYWPGLQYHYEGRRLVGVEGEFVSSAHAMSSLVEHFRGCFGDPRYRTTWRDAPEDSDVYRRRLVSYGWHDRQTCRAIWLIGDDELGYLRVNTLSDACGGRSGGDAPHVARAPDSGKMTVPSHQLKEELCKKRH